jgi:hypothetical protein
MAALLGLLLLALLVLCLRQCSRLAGMPHCLAAEQVCDRPVRGPAVVDVLYFTYMQIERINTLRVHVSQLCRWHCTCLICEALLTASSAAICCQHCS